MFKACTVINKNTDEMLQGWIDEELQHLEDYPYREASVAELQAINEANHAKELIKTELLSIYSTLSEGDQGIYQNVLNKVLKYLDDNNITKLKETISTLKTFGFTDLETFKTQMITKLDTL